MVDTLASLSPTAEAFAEQVKVTVAAFSFLNLCAHVRSLDVALELQIQGEHVKNLFQGRLSVLGVLCSCNAMHTQSNKIQRRIGCI